ncbi:MAG: polysaccharide pyruvyl transferase family protein [Hyphomicrobium sp.]|nr:MAG: polysaccharide pyruvyl transferase family protein [Hyphomicrobium sp.]
MAGMCGGVCMKFAQMICAMSVNIGDDIQSVAAARLLPQVDQYVDRESLNSVPGPKPVCIIMNAWFMAGDGWPPSPFVRPIFVGFHTTPGSQPKIGRHSEYLRRYEPIGVRDRGTAHYLNSHGISTEVTYCVTLTLPPRNKVPVRGKVVIVDANDISVPRTLRRGAVRLTHIIPGMNTATKLQYAKELIEFYRENAALVITRRLHCALPCIAMGIPTVFFGNPKDTRTMIVSDIGGIIYNKRLYRVPLLSQGMIDWSPRPLDISPVRQRLLQTVATRLETVGCTPVSE